MQKYPLHKSTKGSMLIWVIMLGAILSSVFLVMAMRLRASTEAQRETMEYLSAKNYLESIADYWSKAPLAEDTLSINLDGDLENIPEIVGTLTQKIPELTGLLEPSQPLTKKINIGDIICWGKTGEANNLIVDNELMDDPLSDKYITSCDDTYIYSKTFDTGPTDHTFQTLSPVHYKIKASTTIADTAWHITLTQELSYGKSVTVTRTLP